MHEVSPAAQPQGTLVEVRDLFYNLPARRKFLRAESTELGHIARLVERFALARFDVAFRLRHGGRVLLDAPVADTPALQRARIGAIMGESFIDGALPIERRAGRVSIQGWLGQPEAARVASDQQYAYVNGRAVRDRLLANAIRLGYRDVLYHGRQPAYLLHLEIEPEWVDVNAHPQKLEVRFRDARQIHDFVFRAVHDALGVGAGVAAPTASPAALGVTGSSSRSPRAGSGRAADLPQALRRRPVRRLPTCAMATARPRRFRKAWARAPDRSASRWHSCTASTSSRRARPDWCSWTRTRRTNASSMNA
jgi:DNA mismatch repair protein MutL